MSSNSRLTNSPKVRNDGEKAATARVLVAIGDDFESANSAVMYHARGVVATAEKLSGENKKEIEALTDGVRPEWLENWYDGLTYCKEILLKIHQHYSQLQVHGMRWANNLRKRRF